MSTTAQTEQQTTWDIDAAHSLVEVSAKHMMFTTVKGRFTGMKGTIVTNWKDHSQSRVEAEIDAGSFTTGNEQRDNHLRSPDFLDVAQYPTITFTSTRVEPRGADRLRVVGNLTLHGATQEVTLDTTFNGEGRNPYGKEIAGFTAETTINRKDFGLNWNVALESGGWLVSDTLKILLEVQAIKRGA